MAVANKCDRCGKFYNHYPIDNQIGIYNGFKLVRSDAGGKLSFEKIHEDLCPDCMDEFNKWFNMKGENYECKNV